jgi:hypothetical protein
VFIRRTLAPRYVWCSAVSRPTSCKETKNIRELAISIRPSKSIRVYSITGVWLKFEIILHYLA